MELTSEHTDDPPIDVDNLGSVECTKAKGRK